MRIHVPALFHTIVSQDYSHCAFTGKILRFAKMMRAQGAEIIEYGNPDSESLANEHVVLRSREEFDRLHPKDGFVGTSGKFGSPSHQAFARALVPALRARVRPGDIVAHPLGTAHSELVNLFPEAIHVETGIGYEAGPFGAYRIYESEAWRHWHFGRHPKAEKAQSYVAPNYYDLDDWPFGAEHGTYYAFMARKCQVKGLYTVAELIRRNPDKEFRIAGQGEEWPDWAKFLGMVEGCTNWVNAGDLKGRERAAFLGGAIALLCPTEFVEPFGGASIEAMLCGTPAITSAWGAYTETIPEDFRCRTLEDYERAMGLAKWENRQHGTRAYAQGLYSLETVGNQYTWIFEQIQKHAATRVRTADELATIEACAAARSIQP